MWDQAILGVGPVNRAQLELRDALRMVAGEGFPADPQASCFPRVK